MPILNLLPRDQRSFHALPLLGGSVVLLAFAALHAIPAASHPDHRAPTVKLPAASTPSLVHGALFGTLPAARRTTTAPAAFLSPLDRQWQDALESRLRKLAEKRTVADALREFLESSTRPQKDRDESLFGIDLDEVFFRDPVEVLARRQWATRDHGLQGSADTSIAAFHRLVASLSAPSPDGNATSGPAPEAFGVDTAIAPINVAPGVSGDSPSSGSVVIVTSSSGAALPPGAAPFSPNSFAASAGASLTIPSTASSDVYGIGGSFAPTIPFGVGLSPAWHGGFPHPATSTERSISWAHHGGDAIVPTLPVAPSTTSFPAPGQTLAAASAIFTHPVSAATSTVSPALVTASASITAPPVNGGSTAAPATTTQLPQAYAWGFNQNGQAGNGTQNNNISTPTLMILPANGVTGVAAAGSVSFAIDGGKIYGAGSSGSLIGIGNVGQQSTPVAQTTLTSGVTAVIGGGNSANYAIANGAAYGWGGGAAGDVGDGTTTARSTPVPVSGLGSGVTAMAGGFNFALAIQNGAVYAWGQNSTHIVDNTANNPVASPEAISGLGSGVTAIAAGNSTALAVQNGAVYIWGNGSATPALVSGLPAGVTAVAAGSQFSLALQGGVAYAWGTNGQGQLGQGNTTTEATPVAVPIPGTVVAIAAGVASGYAITADGRLYDWGSDSEDELGDGGIASRQLSPTLIAPPSGLGWIAIDADADGHTVVAIAGIPEPATTGLLFTTGLVLTTRPRRRRG